MKEADIMRDIMIKATDHNSTLFRNNVGECWIGESTLLKDGSVLIYNPRRFHAGLCVGSADLIGWTEIIVTPEMVGKKIAIFTAPEVKKKKGKKSDLQRDFRTAVVAAGGIAGFVKSPQELKELVLSFVRSLS